MKKKKKVIQLKYKIRYVLCNKYNIYGSDSKEIKRKK